MRQFRSFVIKEFLHILRDRRTMLIVLIMPIVQIILFGFAITNEVKNAKVAVYDPSCDVETQRIRQRIDASPYFSIVENISDYRRINDVFKEGKANLVVVFSKDFADNLLHTGDAAIQLIADGSEPNQATTQVGYISQILSSYQQELMQRYHVPMRIEPNTRMLYNPQRKDAYNFVPGVMGMIMVLICAMMTSIAIVREKEIGTMEVLLASPVKPLHIILAKMTPYMALSVVNLISILLLSIYVLGVPAGNLGGLILLSILFIFLSLALGLMISNLVSSQAAAMLISAMGLMIPTILLSGIIFPIESMPVILRDLSLIVPARWYVSAVRKLMIQGVPVQYVWQEFIIIGAMAVFLMAVSLKKFKVRLM
jgi:ABC-2 type transport system permease protein